MMPSFSLPLVVILLTGKVFMSFAFQTHVRNQHSSWFRAFSSETATIDAEVTAATNSIKSPHILSFLEPTTQVPVKLVGAMHYNPHSIEVARVS